MASEILVKVHESYRKIVAICDSELLGKRFEEGKRQLDVKKDFFDGEKKKEDEVIRIIRHEKADDASFNIVGKKSVDAALKAGLIDKNGIMKIQGIPFALSLL